MSMDEKLITFTAYFASEEMKTNLDCIGLRLCFIDIHDFG